MYHTPAGGHGNATLLHLALYPCLLKAHAESQGKLQGCKSNLGMYILSVVQ